MKRSMPTMNPLSTITESSKVLHTRRSYSRSNAHDCSNPLLDHQPWKHTPRNHRSGPSQSDQPTTFLPAATPRQRHKRTPVDHHGTRPRRQSNRAPPAPHTPGPNIHNPADQHNSLPSTHRTLKRQGRSLLSDLEKLVAALEVSDPDPEEMEWVSSSTETVCHVPYHPLPAQNDDHGVWPEAEAECSPKTVPGAHIQQHTPLQRESGTAMDPQPGRGSTEDYVAGGASLSASWPTVAGGRDGQLAAYLDARPPCCPDSCFCERMWDRMP